VINKSFWGEQIEMNVGGGITTSQDSWSPVQDDVVQIGHRKKTRTNLDLTEVGSL